MSSKDLRDEAKKDVVHSWDETEDQQYRKAKDKIHELSTVCFITRNNL
jgi:hypothetical protein